MALVSLGFQATEPLTELAERLTAAGYPAEICSGDNPKVVVTDPDGQRLEVHPRG